MAVATPVAALRLNRPPSPVAKSAAVVCPCAAHVKTAHTQAMQRRAVFMQPSKTENGVRLWGLGFTDADDKARQADA